jgi:tetratricopeptide (TPR) repeat protein
MAMIRNTRFFSLALILIGAPTLFAQEEEQIVPVADEGIEENSDYSVPEATPEDELVANFELFKQLMKDNVFDEADTVAKRVVELALRLKGPQSSEFAKALTNLAIVQFQTEQYTAAQQNFESAIEIIEDNEDRLNVQLVNPLKGLGAAQLESGRPDLASRTFQRAVHVTHVNEGPHNLDQIDLLESIAETHIRMGDLESARDAQDMIYSINVRKYALDTPELVPSLMRRARWQHKAGFISDERVSYRRAIRIIEKNSGRDSLDLVEPLIMLGRSFFYLDMSGQAQFSDSSMSSGEIYFRRAARIAEEHPDTNWQVVVQAQLALGDYYMYSNNSQRGRQVYVDTWNLLSEQEDGLNVRRVQLEQVVPLKQNKLPMYISSDEKTEAGDEKDNALLQGSVSMSYTVSTRGQATDLKMIEAKPPEFERMISIVQREVRRRIYRPRMEDGKVVESPDLILVHKYFYRQSDLDAAQAALEADRD